jgi:hypothetical protein
VNNDIFAETLIPSNTTDFKDAVETFKIKIDSKVGKVKSLLDEYGAYPFASLLRSYHQLLQTLCNERNLEQIATLVLEQKDELKTARDNYMFIVEFIEHNFKAYEQISSFVQANENNFASLDDAFIPRSQELIQYLRTDHEPWNRFPQMKKAYKELSAAVKTSLDHLRTEVVKQYEIIFEEIESRKNELGIKEANLTTNTEYYLSKIKSENKISELRIYALGANDFRSENFRKLEDFKAKEDAKKSGKPMVTSVDVSIAAEMSPTTIENEQELDAYLKVLKDRLMTKLSKSKKLWLR